MGALLALLGLLGGIPAGLLQLAGAPPVPTSWPTLQTITQRIGTEQLLAVMLAVVWLAWLQFVVCTLVEVVAAVQGGVLARPVPLSGPTQRLARGLVAAILLSTTLAVQASAAVGPMRSQHAVVQVDRAAAGQVRVQGAAAAPADGVLLSDERAAGATAGVLVGGQRSTATVSAHRSGADPFAGLYGKKVYVVQAAHGRHHDSLWEIAERHLGDGRRYREIHDLNVGRSQPDGRSLHLARLIQPGWYLEMPEDAVGVERLVDLSEIGTPVAQVAHDDDHASANRTVSPTHSAAATHSAPASQSAPATHSAPATQGAPATQAAAAPGVGAHTGRPTTRPTTGPTTRPTGAHVSATAPHTGHTPAGHTASGHASPSHASSSHPPGGAVAGGQATLAGSGGDGLTGDLGLELGGAGLLGAALLGALRVARRRGRPVAPPSAAVEAEVWLRIGADTRRSRRIDQALRGLALSCRETGRPFPKVHAAMVDDSVVDLLLLHPVPDPPEPWIALNGATRWRLARPTLPRLARDIPSPLPALVGLGRDVRGCDILLDLSSAGGPVCVTGSVVVAEQVARALAVELATNPWSAGMRVTAVDLPAGLAELGTDRLEVPADPADPLAGLRARLPGPEGSRPGPTPEGAGPEFVVLGRTPSRQVADDLRVLSSSGAGVGVIVAGDVPGARWRIAVDDAGSLTVPDTGLTVTANRLGDEALARLGELFVASRGTVGSTGPLEVGGSRGPGGTIRLGGTVRADAPAGPAGLSAPGGSVGSLGSVGLGESEVLGLDAVQPAGLPAMPRPVDDGAWAAAQARVGLLGPVLVRAPGTLDPIRVEHSSELVAFLAVYPDGVHPTVLSGALWPRGVEPEVRDAAVGRVREWLGTDESGNHRLRIDPDGRLYLSGDVVVDWNVVCTLLGRARVAHDRSLERDLLVRALHLVRGPLASEEPSGRYAWLARTGLERIVPSVVADAAHRLADLCGDTDPVAAAEAARSGLRADPTNEMLWRDILRAEFRQWGPDGVRAATVTMAQVLADHAMVPGATTLSLVEELAPRTVTGALGV